MLEAFTQLDDTDLYSAIKTWAKHEDFTLSKISNALINRDLPKIIIQKESFEETRINGLRKLVKETYSISDEEVNYIVFDSAITNNAYNAKEDVINIKYKNGDILNITDASDNFNIQSLTEPVKKYFVCYPKEFRGKW